MSKTKQMLKKISKRITLCFVVLWILIFCIYSSILIGTLAHELTHKQNSVNPIAIEINYDTSGVTKADFFYQHSHEWVYLNGYIVGCILIIISMLSVFVILFFRESEEKDANRKRTI